MTALSFSDLSPRSQWRQIASDFEVAAAAYKNAPDEEATRLEDVAVRRFKSMPADRQADIVRNVVDYAQITSSEIENIGQIPEEGTRCRIVVQEIRKYLSALEVPPDSIPNRREIAAWRAIAQELQNDPTQAVSTMKQMPRQQTQLVIDNTLALGRADVCLGNPTMTRLSDIPDELRFRYMKSAIEWLLEKTSKFGSPSPLVRLADSGLLSEILKFTTPTDTAAVAQTCTALRTASRADPVWKVHLNTMFLSISQSSVCPFELHRRLTTCAGIPTDHISLHANKFYVIDNLLIHRSSKVGNQLHLITRDLNTNAEERLIIDIRWLAGDVLIHKMDNLLRILDSHGRSLLYDPIKQRIVHSFERAFPHFEGFSFYHTLTTSDNLILCARKEDDNGWESIFTIYKKKKWEEPVLTIRVPIDYNNRDIPLSYIMITGNYLIDGSSEISRTLLRNLNTGEIETAFEEEYADANEDELVTISLDHQYLILRNLKTGDVKYGIATLAAESIVQVLLKGLENEKIILVETLGYRLSIFDKQSGLLLKKFTLPSWIDSVEKRGRQLFFNQTFNNDGTKRVRSGSYPHYYASLDLDTLQLHCYAKSGYLSGQVEDMNYDGITRWKSIADSFMDLNSQDGYADYLQMPQDESLVIKRKAFGQEQPDFSNFVHKRRLAAAINEYLERYAKPRAQLEAIASQLDQAKTDQEIQAAFAKLPQQIREKIESIYDKDEPDLVIRRAALSKAIQQYLQDMQMHLFAGTYF